MITKKSLIMDDNIVTGHSRTIIGYEKHKDGKATLLVLDPSHSPAQVRHGNLKLRQLKAIMCNHYRLLFFIINYQNYETSKKMLVIFK
jgi:hypothetical protein